MDDEKGLCLKDGFSSPETEDFIASLQNLDKFYKAEVTADEPAIIVITSGSTGFSKLVAHTHALLLKCFQFLKQGSLDEYTMTFSCSPLGWIGGYTFIYVALGKGRLLLDMWNGAPDDMDKTVWDILVQESCHDGVVMPFLLPDILALKNRQTWKMRTLTIAGQPINSERIHQALQLSEKVLVSYASSELLMITAVLITDAAQYRDYLAGKPLPNNTVKICDSEGHEVPRGTKGEIYAKTSFMTKAYVNNEEDTASSFTADGFLKTGDIGVMLEGGSLLVEGRQHDAIHRGNYIFYPAWLESRIMECCPGLQDVFVVGVPDHAMGEELCACFVPSYPSVTEERVRSLVEKDILTNVEDPLSPRPRYFLRFEAFPKTYTDKSLRKDVRRQATERLNLA